MSRAFFVRTKSFESGEFFRGGETVHFREFPSGYGYTNGVKYVKISLTRGQGVPKKIQVENTAHAGNPFVRGTYDLLKERTQHIDRNH
jgi:hypothetical protein